MVGSQWWQVVPQWMVRVDWVSWPLLIKIVSMLLNTSGSFLKRCFRSYKLTWPLSFRCERSWASIIVLTLSVDSGVILSW